MTATVLINRGGGAVAADSEISDKVAAALAKAGVEAKVELVDGGDCAVRSKAIAERGDPLLIVGGGDGTISAAASALVGTETRLGILPLGTLNHFARDLGIPTDLDAAARLIAGREDRGIDVAEMNDRVFINNSAIGLYPLMVVDRDVQQRRADHNRSGHAVSGGKQGGARAERHDRQPGGGEQRRALAVGHAYISPCSHLNPDLLRFRTKRWARWFHRDRLKER